MKAILIAAILLLVPMLATAQEVEIDTFMPVNYNYCYNLQRYTNDPTNRDAQYRLELLVPAYSTNGRITGLLPGFMTRGVFCNDLTFVDNVLDWRPEK